MALTVDGKVFSWGEGDDGKLGHFSRMWVDVIEKKKIDFNSVISSPAIYLIYKIWRSRLNLLFYLFSRNCDKPRLIEALRSKRVRDIACGSSHSAAIISNGDLYTWGLGEYGRLGHGDNTTQLRPKQVSGGVWCSPFY